MYKLNIVVHGDNERLHREALKAAVEAVESANPTNSVYRAWLEETEDDEAVGVPNGHTTDRGLAIDAPDQPDDLSGYRIAFVPTLFGWTWKAEAPDGRRLSPSSASTLIASARRPMRYAPAPETHSATPSTPQVSGFVWRSPRETLTIGGASLLRGPVLPIALPGRPTARRARVVAV